MDAKKDNDSKLEIFNFEGARYKTHLTKKFRNRQNWKPVDTNQVLAKIPGTVIKICVKEGQKVSEGKCLYILEAMKMNNRFNAEKACIVSKILVKEGDMIRKLRQIMELEDLPPKKSIRSRTPKSKT